jgi:hypothetical protein
MLSRGVEELKMRKTHWTIIGLLFAILLVGAPVFCAQVFGIRTVPPPPLVAVSVLPSRSAPEAAVHLDNVAASRTDSDVPRVRHSVTLSWNACISNVIGYNVYRGTTSGGPYTQLNSSVNVLTTFTDSTVQAGGSYHYVVTSVDSSNVESEYSAEISATVPKP